MSFLKTFTYHGGVTLRILTEASGSLTSGFLITAIQEACCEAIASDVDENCYAKAIADDFILMPSVGDPNLWPFLYQKLIEKNVKLVIPSLDETLLDWSLHKKQMNENGVNVLISPQKTVEIFTDKWLTYHFFKENGIPTPSTSIEQDFELVKPRRGRGSKGIQITNKKVDMVGMISQEYVEGTEYTIDVLCDLESQPIYIVPRIRMGIRDGKSTAGIVIEHEEITNMVKKICHLIPFVGPINIQCIQSKEGDIKFIEINPRIAGGMALGFAATENWIKTIIDIFNSKEINPKSVQYGLKMRRYYHEVFF